MRRIQKVTPITAHAGVTALPFVPTSSAYVGHWNDAHGAVPEFDLELWAISATNVTVAEALAGVPHPYVISDAAFTATHGTETITKATHGLLTGDGPIRLTNVGGALPAGLAADTDYWVIYSTANTFFLAASLQAALAGTKVTFTGDGTGTHTYVDTADTKRVYWHSIGFLGVAGAGAVTLTDSRGYIKRLPHHPQAVAYAVGGTLSAAVATSVAVTPVVEV